MAGIKINGDTSGSTTITAPNTGTDETIELSTALASKLPYSYGTATPSTTDSGFLWYDSNSTPAAPKFWDGSAFQPVNNLFLITKETFSAVSSVSLNSVFTADYPNYLVDCQLAASTTVVVNLRMRASGSDNTAGNYRGNSCAMPHGSTSAVEGFGSVTNTSQLFRTLTTANHGARIYLQSPQAAQTTFWHGTAVGANVAASQKAAVTFGYTHETATQFDGFTIFPDTGTITGTIRVYGYKD